MAAARLKDVAERAGVSIKTVSNVVRGQIRVAEPTRSRVQQAIDELGYRPNASARSLRTGRSGVIALAVPELVMPYFGELAGAVIAAAKARGVTVMIEETGGDPQEEFRIASGAGDPLIDGVLLSPLALEHDRLAEREPRLPLVLLGERSYERHPADHVLIDNVAAARDVTAHLLERGARRVAVIGAPRTEHATGRQRLLGYQQALTEAGLPQDPRLAPPVTAFRRADGAAALGALLDLPDPPDAVFCFNDLLALGALRAAHERKVRVPEDLLVAGFDDVEEARYSIPSLTSIAPNKRELARMAVDALLVRVDAGEERAQTVLRAPYTLVVRESTGGSAG